MERIARIEIMEEKLNAARAALDAMELALEAYEAAREDLRELESYLTGPDWRADLAADEAGLLPEGLRRGVLSEDGIYNLLEDDDELRERLKALL